MPGLVVGEAPRSVRECSRLGATTIEFEAEKLHDRYNYLYSEEQLEPWKARVETISS